MSVATAPLAELAFVNPPAPKLSPNERVSFLPMANASEDGSVAISNFRSYSEVKVGYTGFENGDVLVAKVTPCFENNKIVSANLPTPFGFGSTEFHVIRPGERLDARFLHRFLRQDWVRFAGERRMTGSGGQRRVPKAFLEALPVPDLPLPAQRRIAAILDQADALRRLHCQSLARADELEQAIFRQVFGDLVSNSMGWREDCVLGDVAEVASGITKGRKLNGTMTREVPYLAVSNVQDGHVRLDVVKTIDATEAEIARYQLRAGDIVLTEGGDPDKLGRGGIWRCEIPECIHQNHIFRVRITDASVRSFYLSRLIASQRGKRYFLRSAKQTTGIASINMTQLKNFPLLLPPVSIQMNYEEEMEKLERDKHLLKNALIAADSLFASLQHRAFRGEL